jgi:osmoprotectant transport system permease protein
MNGRFLLRADPVGALLTAIATAGLAALPFVVLKANRILPGEARALTSVLDSPTLLVFCATLLATASVALRVGNPRWRLLTAIAATAVVAMTLAEAADVLTPPGNRAVRVAPGGAFWILAVAIAMLATDAIARMRLGPVGRLVALAGFLLGVSLALGSGHFDQLSILREHAVHHARFLAEGRRHVLLVVGPLLAAVVVAVPLGIACHRRPGLRAAALGMLSVVQTIPSIALFGILMAPLAAIAAAAPWLAGLGIRGIGAAPAAVALFLYALFPVVANTVAGLARVDPAIVDAARGMGLTRSQVLRQVEFPLALPVVLSGIRIVLVQNVGLVTIAALIGGGGFGVFVFQGIGQTAIDLVLLGALPTVVLAFSAAVVLDAAIALARGGRR